MTELYMTGARDSVSQAAQNRQYFYTLLRRIPPLLLKIAVITGTVSLLFTFMFGLLYTRDPSMTPAIKDGDLVMFYRLDKKYIAQDIVVFDFEDERQMRRVIATAGNVVDITEEGLLIDGALQQEPKIYTPTHRFDTGVDFPLTLKEGQIFVLADNRENAADSRVYGAVDIENTSGKVMTVLRRRDM